MSSRPGLWRCRRDNCRVSRTWQFFSVTDMTGGGPFRLPVGAWTDDTSMALCLASSLVELGRFDAADQMRRYCQWHENGYLSSTGRCFDIGATVRGSLARFQRSGDPFSGSTDPQSAGNGCIMRLAPVPMFFHPDSAEAARWAGESSRTTHGAPECVESCQLLAAMICAALSGGNKDDVLFGHDPSRYDSPKSSRSPPGSTATRARRRFRDRAMLSIAWRRRHGASGNPNRSVMRSCWRSTWATTRTPPVPSAARLRVRSTGRKASRPNGCHASSWLTTFALWPISWQDQSAPNQAPQQTAAAMLVARGSLTLSSGGRAELGRSAFGSGPNPMPELSAEFALRATKEERTVYLPRGVRTRFTWPCGGRVSRMVSVVEGVRSGKRF